MSSNFFLIAQRFAPLLSLGSKRAAELTDSDLHSVATALVGDAADEFLPLLTHLRASEPDTVVSKILASPAAKGMYQKLAEMHKAREEDESSLFVKCTVCGALQEADLR